MSPKNPEPGPEPLAPHPEEERIARGIQRCLALAVAWSGDTYRAMSQAFANRRDVVTGEGSRMAGARYTPAGAFRAIYGSLDMETALAEALANHREFGLPDADALPLTFVALRVAVERVVDLTRGDVRRALATSRKRLLGPWRPDQTSGREALTQTLGRLARAAGVQGVLYPSAQRAKGRNLVLFPDLLQPGQLQVLHAEQLSARRRRKPP